MGGGSQRRYRSSVDGARGNLPRKEKKKKKQSPSKVVNLRRVELYWEMDPRQKKGADPTPPSPDDRRDHT